MRELTTIHDPANLPAQYAQEMAKVGAIVVKTLNPIGQKLNIGGQLFTCGPEITYEEFIQAVQAAGLAGEVGHDYPAHVRFQRVFTD